MTNAPGKGILKVVGVLFIVFGAIAAVVSLFGLIGGAIITGAESQVAGAAIAGGVVIVGSIIMLISSLLEIFVGVMGVKYCANPEKAQTLMIIAIVLIVLQLIGIFTGASAWAIIVGLILPALFFYGALQNKKAING